RKAVYKQYAQAIPNAYLIDKEGQPGYRGCVDCMACVKACKAGAIEHDQKPEDLELDVGAVVLAMGAHPFDPKVKKELGYGRFKNVVTSLEFERILSASGPFQGHISRPGDEKDPKKIAWIQCVGSRDKAVKHEYCSAMCCMYTAKEAVIAKEHEPDINPTVFYIDVRSYGKDFDRYIKRAREEHGIRYVRSRISEIHERPGSGDLTIRYEDEKGDLHEEIFDMVVLSIGLCMNDTRSKALEELGLDVNEFGFAFSHQRNPVALVKPGMFMSGSFMEPQAIPEAVMQASAAASQAAALLRDARGTLAVQKREFKERDVSGEEPRIGIFVCHCGINIGRTVDVPGVVEYVKDLENVVYAGENIYTCSEDTQRKIVDVIKENKLNRVVVAACTPRTHEPLFKKSLAEAGLNPHLLEMTNIREHCSWVHSDNDLATRKAMDLLSMTIAKSRMLEPIPPMKIEVNQRGLVIGGGVAGMTAALTLADQGYDTLLVEKEDRLGGRLNDLHFTVEGIDIVSLKSDLEKRIEENDELKLMLGSKITSITGYVGNYDVNITEGKKEIKENVGA
ncbi:MAG: FAD-dependent oxidoreductase, partial [Candidatus Thermoplasmatota archaeon]|nr:FAD-dependent oxidoreductase [Candidatus Thermoplasmatota archaeon]